MTISIVVPQLGESVAEGTVSKWLKQVGDRVRKEEPLVEIQTDKINVEIPSPAEGVLQAITVPEGTTVLVGTEIAVLAGVGEAAGAGPEPAAKAAVAAASPSRSAATEAAQAPRPARSQEQSMPTRAPAVAAPSFAQRGGANGGDGAGAVSGEARNLSPAVRKLMREHSVGLDELSRISGSGVAGRVTRDDLLDYLKSRTTAPAMAAAAAPAPAPSLARETGPRPGFLTATAAPGSPGPREEV